MMNSCNNNCGRCCQPLVRSADRLWESIAKDDRAAHVDSLNDGARTSLIRDKSQNVREFAGLWDLCQCMCEESAF